MAGDWLKIELDLPEKPEVHAIAETLNLDPDIVVGKLFKVWIWFNRQTTDGNAYGVTYSLVDRITGVIGFGEAMTFVGWLDQKDKYLMMPKFERHTSESAKKRALTAKRQQHFRNGNVTQEALPREEKRREDNNSNTLVLAEPKSGIPYQKIVDLYHQILPELAKCVALSPKRKGQISARWKNKEHLPNLDIWKKYFEYVRKSDFLMGKKDPAPGRQKFVADLEWLTNESNFIKVWEKKYHG